MLLDSEPYAKSNPSPAYPTQLYGLMSDTVPILGFRRGPYIFIAGALGTMAWMTLALSPPSLGLSALLFLLANYSIASPDVIIDAAVTGQYAVSSQAVSRVVHRTTSNDPHTPSHASKSQSGLSRRPSTRPTCRVSPGGHTPWGASWAVSLWAKHKHTCTPAVSLA